MQKYTFAYPEFIGSFKPQNGIADSCFKTLRNNSSWMPWTFPWIHESFYLNLCHILVTRVLPKHSTHCRSTAPTRIPIPILWTRYIKLKLISFLDTTDHLKFEVFEINFSESETSGKWNLFANMCNEIPSFKKSLSVCCSDWAEKSESLCTHEGESGIHVWTALDSGHNMRKMSTNCSLLFIVYISIKSCKLTCKI